MSIYICFVSHIIRLKISMSDKNWYFCECVSSTISCILMCSECNCTNQFNFLAHLCINTRLHTFTSYFFRRSINMYLQFISFLRNIMALVVEILSCKRMMYLFCIVGIVAAADLATQGAKASATMILTSLNRDNSVLARWGYLHRVLNNVHSGNYCFSSDASYSPSATLYSVLLWDSGKWNATLTGLFCVNLNEKYLK